MAVVVEAVYGCRKGESRAGGTGRHKGESRAGGTGRHKGEKVNWHVSKVRNGKYFCQ